MQPAGPARLQRLRLACLAAFLAASWPAVSAEPLKLDNDLTFRPSVIVRQGRSLGTGVIIASIESSTLILTASHVVEGSQPIEIELNRFNLGLEKTKSSDGFPRRIDADLVVRDADADLAILEIKKELAFPYMARLAPGEAAPDEGTRVMTIGFDKGEKLIGFTTRVRNVERLDMGHGGGVRDFLVTEDPPEVGRSGGGLFRGDGSLVGVCVARAELVKGRKLGLFATLANVRALIKTDDQLRITLLRSSRRPKSPAR